MDNTNKAKVNKAFNSLSQAFDRAECDLINIIQTEGGIIRTAPSGDKPTLYCFVDYNMDMDYNTTESLPIQALAYDEGEGLMVLTNAELQNYEYDEGFEFDYYYDYEGEDKERYEDATKDLTYFRTLDDGYTAVRETIFSILAGLADYLS